MKITSVAFPLAISLLPPQTAVVHHYLPPQDIIAKPVAAEREPPLAFTNRDSYKLLDMVGSAAVVRVGHEDIEGSALESPELRMALEKGPK